MINAKMLREQRELKSTNYIDVLKKVFQDVLSMLDIICPSEFSFLRSREKSFGTDVHLDEAKV